MDRQKFERITRNNRLKPVIREPTEHGDILIAEGFFLEHPEMPEPHWMMMWAVDRDNLDIGQVVYITGKEAGYPGPLFVPAHIRRNAAIGAAKEFIEECLDVGRYTH